MRKTHCVVNFRSFVTWYVKLNRLNYLTFVVNEVFLLRENMGKFSFKRLRRKSKEKINDRDHRSVIKQTQAAFTVAVWSGVPLHEIVIKVTFHEVKVKCIARAFTIDWG